MNLLEAILLGIIQGLTEFLPISSTAHLTLAAKLFRFIDAEHPEVWTHFIAVMQLGTLAAVLAYFRRDIWLMATSLVRDLGPLPAGATSRKLGSASHMALAILLGTIPVVVVGVLLRDTIEGAFTKSTVVLISSLTGLACLLWIGELVSRHERSLEQLSLRDAFLIGCAQMLALIPGASRSGTTLTAGLFLGLRRDAAARFSFLLSIPAVLGSGLFEMMRIDRSVFALGLENLVMATAVSALAGYAAIAWLLRYLMRNTAMVFVWYRLALGALLALSVLTGWIQP